MTRTKHKNKHKSRQTLKQTNRNRDRQTACTNKDEHKYRQSGRIIGCLSAAKTKSIQVIASTG